ncbi:MAG: Crp/Fnr family transcriptional regulator [Flexistipes sinusarabici]|uniref:Crp/Fnr family transcriptional regulator n=1 Tax=Flexistipes sinusarabici TaxID=2352 RepID=A0A5D0MRC1_FLESI|nr:Crp/Fnr family transcriptional regulator [Flexistipes sinusarabici]TYB33419.1 MAG: Crp/Fnr family transcriptional regulator [Flexistipes sinusarabici]
MNKDAAVKMFLNIFAGSRDEDVYKTLYQISSVASKEKKEIFFLEDEEGSNIYFLLSGVVKLSKTNDEGKEAVIHFVKSGEIFAEILLYLKNRYPVTATALEDCEALAIDSKKLFDEIKRQPELSMKLIGVLAGRIKYFVNMIENLTLADTRKRFLSYLNNIAEKQNSKIVTLPVNKGELALLLGSTPETFSRLLKKLAEEGVIKVKGKEITLIDLGELQ